MLAQLQINDPLPDGTERWRAATPGDFGTTADGKVLIGGARDKWRCGFNSADEVAAAFAASGFDTPVRFDGDTAGARFAMLVRSALSAPGSEAILTGKRDFTFPVRMGFGLSMNQRAHGEMFVIEAVAVDDSGNVMTEPGRKTFGDPVSIVQASVTSNVMTITTSAEHGLKIDDLAVVYGNADTRMNTQGKVTAISDLRTFQMSLAQANTSFVTDGAVVSKIEPAGGAASAFGLLIEGNSGNVAYCWSKSAGASASIGVQQTLGTSWSDPTQTVGQNWCVSRLARFTTELTGTADMLRYVTQPSDSTGSLGASIKRTQNTPEMGRRYIMRFRVLTLPNSMPPIEILTATKSGTTTATVITAVPHGLKTGAHVRIFGAANTTDWANVTAEVPITVTGPDSFTVTWGTAVNSVVYGGLIKPVYSGSTTGYVTSVPRAFTWVNDRIWLGLSGNWTPYIGETVRVLGCRNSAGTAGIDGQHRVIAVNPVVTGNFNTTSGSAVVTCNDTSRLAVGMIVSGSGVSSLSILSIVPNTSITLAGNATVTGSTWLTITGLVLEPLNLVSQPNGTSVSLSSTSGGGALIRETDLSLHFARALDYTRTPVEVTGGNQANDQNGSVPSVVVNTVNTNTPEGTPFNPTTHTLSSAATTNATLVKSTGGIVYNIALTNYGAAPAFFKLFNKASAPTVGTDIPDMVLEVPAGKSVIFPFERFGYRCGSGIGYTITAAQAIADTAAIAASQVRVAMTFI